MAEAVLGGNVATFGEALFAAGDQLGSHEAFVDGELRLSFDGWAARAACLAGALRREGVRPGDVVCLMLPSSADFAVAYAGASLAGAVVTAINGRLGPVEVDAILARCAPVAVIGSGSERPRVREDYAGILIGREELAGLYAGPPLDGPVAVAPESPAVIVWTTGTTGLPKGAWFDHLALAAGARVSGDLSAPYDRRLISSPMAHAAFMTRAWDQLAWGIAGVLTPTPWTAEAMLDLMVRERITVGQGVPTQWEKLMALPGFATADLRALRIAGTGATRVPRELIRAMRERLGCPIAVRYASTEVPAISGTRADDSLDVLEGTVGRALDGVRLRVLDHERRDVAPGEVGRIAVTSPFRMSGYWREEEQTAAVLTDEGMLVSSDLGHLDDDGNLVLAGRASEVYIRGGYNVYPLEVENALCAHLGVRSAAVLGMPAPIIGEIGVAFVVLEEDVTATEDQLRAWCRKRIADYKVPDRFVYLDELPLNAMMKVEKSVLARLLQQGAPA